MGARWMRRGLLLAVLLCPLMLAAQAAPGGSGDLMGRRVASVRIPGAGDRRESELLEKIPLKSGMQLERESLRESLRVLFESGRFAEVEANAEPLASGDVALEFRTRVNYFNGNITVSGLTKSGPNESQVVSTGRLELGAPFTDEALQESENRILRLMHDNGYWRAQVSAALHPEPNSQQMNVEFQVKAGEAARVGKLKVNGDPHLSEEEAVKICRMQPGRRVRGELLQHAVTRLRKRYVKQRRLRAQLQAGVPAFHPESNTVDYSFSVDRGPVVDIHAEGAPLSRGKLKRLIPVYEEHAVDEDLLNEGRRNLRDYLQEQGYFDVEVQVRTDEDPEHDREHIFYSVELGGQNELRAIEIRGNQRFDTATLRERMSTQVAGVLLRHGRYSQALLANDLDAIRELYLANGYQSVKVTSEVMDDFAGERGSMKVIINVDEGPLVLVSKLEIRGTQAIGEKELRNLINTEAGQPFSEATIANDREVVLNEYMNRGFPAVQMESSASYADDEHRRMNVVYEIHEGPQIFVNRVLVSGVEHTKPHIVNRAVALKESAPLSQERVLQTQRNLYDLGIFNEVQTAVENPEGDEKSKDVLLLIKEAKRWTFDYGLGLEVGTGLNMSQGGSPQGETGASPRATFNMTRINFRGRDQSLIFKSHFGNLEKRASLSFDQPRWFDLPNWRLTVTGLYDNTRDVNTFSSERLEGSVQLTERATRATQILYRFAYRRVKVDPNSFPPGFSPDLIPFYSRPVRVGMPSIIYLRDKRDDPVNSTKGTYNTVDMGVASGYFGSEANFGRLLAQNATYHRFRRNWVFARSLRIGVEMPYGSPCLDVSAASGACPSEAVATGYVPLPERFFVGGSNSHRGFAINQAGPRDADSGAPLGGNAMIVNNLELRLPAYPLPYLKENLSFVLFHDIGNAFGTSNEMWKNLGRFSQRDEYNCRDTRPTAPACDFSYMSQAVGSGVRYRTPIGPVRVDFGYNLNPPFFPVRNPCANVNPCTAVPHYDQVHHFNFFFSIGQTF
jgi:outer membrane protein assembly complex protein YaeT